jgi:sugar lactone lactonase YvrE
MTEIACVVEAHDALGECCLWCPTTRRVWWLDIQKPALQSYDPVTREHRVYPLPGKHCGCAALRRSGGLVLALDTGLHGYDPATGKLNLLVHAEPDELGNRYNDGRCDRRGRLWIGTMDIGIRRASGSFYRIGADRGVLRLFRRHHGAELDRVFADDRTLYFADTPRHVIWAFDFNLHAGHDRRTPGVCRSHRTKRFPRWLLHRRRGLLWNAEYGGRRLTRYAPDAGPIAPSSCQ